MAQLAGPAGGFKEDGAHLEGPWSEPEGPGGWKSPLGSKAWAWGDLRMVHEQLSGLVSESTVQGLEGLQEVTVIAFPVSLWHALRQAVSQRFEKLYAGQ